METLWDLRYAQSVHRMGSSVIRNLVTLTERADYYLVRGGLPAHEVFPMEDCQV